MRYLIPDQCSLITAMNDAASGDTIVCQHEAMRAIGERSCARMHPDKEVIFMVQPPQADAIRKSFDTLHNLMRNFPTAFKLAAFEDDAMVQSMDNLLAHAQKALEE
jgi:hypothetical protein